MSTSNRFPLWPCVCMNCSARLDTSPEIVTEYAPGHGQFRRICGGCGMSTWYDRRAGGQQEPERHTCDESPTPPAYTSDPRRAKQFATRKEAESAAVSLHWRRGDVSEINVMGFKLWAISDDHCRLLTPFGFDHLFSEIRRSFVEAQS